MSEHELAALWSLCARFVIEVEHIDHLNELVEGLRSVDGVVTVDRVADKTAHTAAGEGRR